MMDRRKFVVGGGAAAVATTFIAATGGGIPAAAASIAGAGTTSTADHVRRVLDQVNVDLGLVNPAGLQRQFEQGYAELLVSAPRDPNANDLDAWIRRRMVELCGTDSYVAAVTELPETRSLLAFSFLANSQRQETPLPPLEQSMRVPIVLRTLEPDFLPELLYQLNERSRASRDFALALRATSAELDRIMAEKLRALPNGRVRAQNSPSGPGESAAFIAGVLMILGFCYWLRDQWRK